MEVGGGGTAQLGPHPERLEDAGGEVVGERHLRARLDVLRQGLEPDVRVDAPRAGPAGRHARLEREPRRVREEVADGGSLRPGGLVQVDRPLLSGDERRERRHELGHGRPAEDVLARAEDVADGALAHDTGRGGLRGPAVDLLEGAHRRAILVAWSAARLLRIPYEASAASRAPCETAVTSRCRNLRRIPTTARILRLDAYGQTRRCLESSSRRSPTSGARRSTSCARGCSCAHDIDWTTSPARTARSSATSARRVRCSSCPNSWKSAWLVEIEADAMLPER